MSARSLKTAPVETGEAPDTVSAESLGKLLRAALPPVRLHSVSMCNAEGDVLWLSEGALGPDEHSVVVDALQTLKSEKDRDYHETGLDDGRFGMFLPVRASRGDLIGLVMLLTELKTLPNGISEQLLNPKVRGVLKSFAAFLKAEIARTGGIPPDATVEAAAVVPVDELFTLEILEEPPPKPLAAAEPASKAPPAIIKKDAPPGDMASELTLSVQELVKLRSSGRTRRFEVFARSRREGSGDRVPPAFTAGSAKGKEGAILDNLVIEQLFSWLREHPEVRDGDPASFSINLSIGSLENPNFADSIAAALKTSEISPESIGFEITEFACVQCKPQVQRFLTACEKLGCFVVIDNFTFDSAALALLASKAVKMVKIDPRLTNAALKEKLPQAVVIAISQACKVLGIHCIAKKVETRAALEWLEATGCDFAQGFALEKPLSLDSLIAPPPPLPHVRGKDGKARR